MPYLTFDLRITSDVGGEPAVVVDYTRRIYLPEAEIPSLIKAAGDPVGVFNPVPAAFNQIPIVNALVIATDQAVNLLLNDASRVAWMANTSYSVGAQVIDTNGNTQQCITAGMSGSTAPTWRTQIGLTTADGTGMLVWTMIGLIGAASIPLKAGGILAIVDCALAIGPPNNVTVNNSGTNPATLSGLSGGT